MRKYYIFSYESGLNTPTGCAGYHGRFSIAGYLAIFSTKQKADYYMNKQTTEKPNKKHVLMSRANARKHFLGDTMECFNHIIENDIDMHEPEEKENEEEEEKNIIGLFVIEQTQNTTIHEQQKFKGFFVASVPNFYENAEKKININLTIGEDIDFNKIAFFTQNEDEKDDFILCEILEGLVDKTAKVVPIKGCGDDFCIEYEDETGHKMHVKVEKAK